MLLSVDKITKRFGGVFAVNNVCLTLNEGELMGIIGPNGSGKTTFLNLVAGAFMCTEGKVVYQGKDVTKMPASQRVRMGIAKVFQITSIFPQLTVWENVVVGLLKNQQNEFSRFMFAPFLKQTDICERAEKILQDVQISSSEMHTLAVNVPHGTQRRLEIAMCLSTNPQLILLDEPMAGITGAEMHGMMDFIKGDLAARHTILIVEHRMDAMMNLAKRIVVMKEGSIIADGTCEEIKCSKVVRDTYLGSYCSNE